jgi:DNA-binding winged helix-turn-helix (wHTH) protein
MGLPSPRSRALSPALPLAVERAVEFRILGPLEAAVDGRPIPVGAAKPSAVLAVLLLHANEVVSVERLIDELWGDAPPPTAMKTVQLYVSQLRRALEPHAAEAIETRAPGYVIHVDLRAGAAPPRAAAGAPRCRGSHRRLRGCPR